MLSLKKHKTINVCKKMLLENLVSLIFVDIIADRNLSDKFVLHNLDRSL